MRLAKGMMKRTEGSGGRIQLTGRPIAILDDEICTGVYGKEHYRPSIGEHKYAPDKVNFKNLLAEAAAGHTITPASQWADDTPRLQTPSPYNHSAPSMEKRDSSQPLLVLQDILERLKAATYRNTPEDDTKFFEHNPLLLHHMLAAAPYTASFCKQCTQYRLCRIHRQTDQDQTSVSLCNHVRMNLYWAIDDPYNGKCSWRLVIKDYTISDIELIMEHRGCRPYRPSDRVGLLAERLIEDMQYRGLRGNVKRAADEIHALVSAWEYATLRQMEKRELRKRAEEKKRRVQKDKERKAQQQLADILKAIEETKKKPHEESKKRKISQVSHSEATPVVTKKIKLEETTKYVEERKARPITPPPEYLSKPAFGLPDFAQLAKLAQSVKDMTEQRQPLTPPRTCAPSPTSTANTEFESKTTGTPTVPDVQVTPPSLPQTRRRSSTPVKVPPEQRQRSSSTFTDHRRSSTSEKSQAPARTPSTPQHRRSSVRIAAIEERRNSLEATSSPSSVSPCKPRKSVRFTPEILSSPMVERTRMMSPPYDSGGVIDEEVSEEEQGFAKEEVVFKGWYDVEDEVNYDDGEIED